MANEVYANGMELACKAGAGKTICAFPDVCFTPPENPATPPGVPLPYPNTGFASDTTEGSKTVKISGKEIMLKNKSFFKTSTGDEAGCAAKKGVISSVHKGKVYFVKWSMDVKFEGENVDRHLDMTTNNHGSLPNEAVPWPFIDSMTAAQEAACKEDKKKEEEACSEDGTSRGKKTKYKSAQDCCDDDKCQKARNCMLVPYGGPGSPNCCKGKTGHHLMPNSLLQSTRGKSSTNQPGLKNTYNVNDGPCVCVKGGGYSDTHGDLHKKSKEKLRAVMESGQRLTYEVAKTKVAEAHEETFAEHGEPQCSDKCIRAQIDASLEKHKKKGEEIEVRQKDGITRKNFEFDGDQD